MKFETFLARFVTVALFATVLAGTWDAWWHGVIGRESLWIPPHLLLYFSTLSAVVAGVYGWYKTKERVWRRLALVLLLVPVSAPFDEIWHRVFGVESISSPVIVWSPPHLLLIGVIIGAFILVLPLLLKDKNAVARNLFGSLVFAGILALTNFVVSPFNPVGPHHLVGFWGAGFETFVFVLVLMIGTKILNQTGSATQITVLYILLFSMGFSHGGSLLQGVIPAHGHAPLWLMIFSLLAPAAFLDLTHKKLPWPVLGAVAGLFSTGLVYSFAHLYFQPQFQYTTAQAAEAILAGTVAGILAGFIVAICTRRLRSQHSLT